MGLIAPVVVDQVAECDMAIVMLDLGQHSGSGHLRLDRTGRGRHLGEFADDEFFEAGRCEQLLGLGIERGEVERHQDVGLAVIDLELERGERVQGGIVDDRAAGFEHAEEGDDILGRVGQEEADMHARADAELLEPRGGAVRQRLQFRVGDPLAHELERRLGAEPLGGVVEHALHRREVERRVRAHLRRKGLHPGLNRHRLSSRSSPHSVARRD